MWRNYLKFNGESRRDYVSKSRLESVKMPMLCMSVEVLARNKARDRCKEAISSHKGLQTEPLNVERVLKSPNVASISFKNFYKTESAEVTKPHFSNQKLIRVKRQHIYFDKLHRKIIDCKAHKDTKFSLKSN